MLDYTPHVKYVGDGEYRLTITAKRFTAAQTFRAANMQEAKKRVPALTAKIVCQVTGAYVAVTT